MHVLIADHETRPRRALQALLAAWPQIEVVGAAANGVEAVQLVEKCRPDVVLMSIPMLVAAKPALPAPWTAQGREDDRPGKESEGMDGLEVIRLIKSQQPQVRVVVLAMYATQRAAALAAGADAFLLKGYPAEALRDAILETG